MVTASAVFHHLTDEQVECADRPRAVTRSSRRGWCSPTASRIGPLKETLIRLDEGEPSRQPDQLYDLFRPSFEVTQTWSYVVPFRTYLYFGFELRPTV